MGRTKRPRPARRGPGMLPGGLPRGVRLPGLPAARRLRARADERARGPHGPDANASPGPDADHPRPAEPGARTAAADAADRGGEGVSLLGTRSPLLDAAHRIRASSSCRARARLRPSLIWAVP